MTWQQATNEMSTSSPAMNVAALMKERDIPEGMKSYVEWTSKPAYVDPCYMTLSNLPEPMTSVCISSDNKYFGTGGLDCLVHLYEMATGKVNSLSFCSFLYELCCKKTCLRDPSTI